MKPVLIHLVFLAVTLQLHAENYYVKLYSDLLDARNPSYLSHRETALDQAELATEPTHTELLQLVNERDLSFVTYAKSFDELWQLRYHGKWPGDTLIAAGETAFFYLKFGNTGYLEDGTHKDLGIIDRILKDLRMSEHPKAPKLLEKLIMELRIRRDKQVVDQRNWISPVTMNSESIKTRTLQKLRQETHEAFLKAARQALAQMVQN